MPISRITESSIQNYNTKKIEIPMRPQNNSNHTPKKFAVKICSLFDKTFNVIIITVKKLYLVHKLSGIKKEET